MDDESLPCPQCGSRKTLSRLREKREQVRLRISESQLKRYPDSPAQVTSGTKILQQRLPGGASGSISLTPPDPHYRNVLEISAPGEWYDPPGSILINGALLDVCMECGTFYASNAKQLSDEIETEIAEMDPLGALAEIRRPEEEPTG